MMSERSLAYERSWEGNKEEKRGQLRNWSNAVWFRYIFCAPLFHTNYREITFDITDENYQLPLPHDFDLFSVRHSFTQTTEERLHLI